MEVLSTAYGPKIRKIYGIVCDYYKLPMNMVDSKCKLTPLKQARQVAHYVCREVLDKKIPLAAIGVIIGGKDHSSVLHSVRVIRSQVEPIGDRKVLDENLRHDVAILKFKANQLTTGDEFFSMGFMITNQN